MKSEYFNKRSQTTQLRGHREKPKPKQINWDRIVYFVLLIAALGFLSYYIFINSFYVSGEGLVVTETMKVRAPSDIEIREHLVSKNSYVEKGDPLFQYSLINWDGTMDEIEEIEKDIADAQEEVYELQDDITLKRQTIEGIQERISYLEQEREDFLEKVRLNAATSYELNDVKRSLYTAQSNLRQAQSEWNVLINNMNRHIQRREILEEKIQEFQTGENRLKTYSSPVSGYINNISIRDNQQAFRSDQILSIKSNNADVYIFSVFDREDAEYIQPGTVMNIEFDNGLKSVGIIRNSYDARENLIDHFKQTGSLTTEYLVVEIAPADSATRNQWLELDRSGLNVYKRKIGGNIAASQIGPSSNEISTTDRTEEKRLQPESNSVSVQSSQPAETQSSLPSVQESLETTSASDSDVSRDSTISSPEYGLLGNVFHDQLDGYTINLYTFEDQQTASEISNDIKNNGYRVEIQPVTTRGEEFWRVVVGQFKTREDALAAVKTLPDSMGDEYFIHHLH